MGNVQNKSTAINNTVNNTMMEAIQQNVMKHSSTASQEQLIKVTKVVGDVEISGVKMKQGASIDVKSALSAMQNSEFQAKIVNDIVQNVQAKTSDVSFQVNSETETMVRNDIQNNIKQSFSQVSESAVANMITQKQEIAASEVLGNVVIKDIDMEQSAEIISEAIMNTEQVSKAVADITNIIDQKAVSTSSGVGLTGLIFMIIIALVIIVGIVMAYLNKDKILGLFSGSDDESDNSRKKKKRRGGDDEDDDE